MTHLPVSNTQIPDTNNPRKKHGVYQPAFLVGQALRYDNNQS